MYMNFEDFTYAVPENMPQLLRVYFPDKPNGHAIVMVHGGAWTTNDRITPYVLNEALARRGMLVASLDFRCGPEFQHPTASSDIAAGIRFVRSNAPEWGIDSQKLGLIGSSSGGHLALFTAIQPDVSIHQQTEFKGQEHGSDVSAQVAYVIALWPVSDPLYRYHHAIDTKRPELIAAHDGFFEDVVQMRNASVQKVVHERNHTHLPPTLVIQPGEDANVPAEMTLNLVREYQNAHGSICYRFMPGLPHAFAYEHSAATQECESYIWQFIQSQLQYDG